MQNTELGLWLAGYWSRWAILYRNIDLVNESLSKFPRPKHSPIKFVRLNDPR